MRTFLRRLIFVLIIGIIAMVLWDNKDRVGLLANNGLKIPGDWYRVEMNFKEDNVYNFSEVMITRDGDVVGSYDLRANTKLEVTLDGQITDYILSFEDDDNMVWSIEVNGRLIPSRRWRR